MTNHTPATTSTEITEPQAVAVDAGLDLLLPPATPRDVLVASCNIGQCDCDTTFVSKIAGSTLLGL